MTFGTKRAPARWRLSPSPWRSWPQGVPRPETVETAATVATGATSPSPSCQEPRQPVLRHLVEGRQGCGRGVRRNLRRGRTHRGHARCPGQLHQHAHPAGRRSIVVSANDPEAICDRSTRHATPGSRSSPSTPTPTPTAATCSSTRPPRKGSPRCRSTSSPSRSVTRARSPSCRRRPTPPTRTPGST